MMFKFKENDIVQIDFKNLVKATEDYEKIVKIDGFAINEQNILKRLAVEYNNKFMLKYPKLRLSYENVHTYDIYDVKGRLISPSWYEEYFKLIINFNKLDIE